MKISKINITSFGKFKNYSLDLNDGFNLIYGNNEDGKTTIMDFIKMMFYGSKNSTKQGYVNPRKRYLPWNNDSMSGSIEFEHQGKSYRLERLFKGRNSSDKINLVNLDSGDITNISGETSPGEDFFGMTLAAFEKSVFIDNSVVYAESGAEGEINTRLSNMTSSGEDTVSAEEIISRIEQAASDIQTATKRGGSIVKDNAALMSLEEQLQTAKKVDALRLERDCEIAEKELEAAALFNRKTQAFEQIKRAEIYKKREKLREFVAAASAYEECEKSLKMTDGSMADLQYCKAIRERLDDITLAQNTFDNMKSQADKLAAEIASLEADGISSNDDYLSSLKQRAASMDMLLSQKLSLSASLDGEIRTNEAQQGAAKPKPNVTLIIIGVALALISVIGAVVSEMLPLLTFGAVGIIMLALGLIIKQKPDNSVFIQKGEKLSADKKKTDAEIKDIRTDIDRVNYEYNDALVQLNTRRNIISEKRETAAKAMAQLTESQLGIMDKKSELFSLAACYKAVQDISAVGEMLEDISGRLSELDRLRTAAEYAAKGTACRNLKDAREHLEKLEKMQGDCNLDAEQIKSDYEEISKQYTELSKDLAALKATALSEYSGVKTPTEVEKEIADLKTQMAEKMAYYDVLQITLDAMQRASDEQRRSFSHILDTKAIGIFSEMTANKYDTLMISKDLDISVSSPDTLGTLSIDALSRGAKEQAYLALRLSLSEIMGQELGGLPIMLDDVFSQYDDERAQSGFDFLEQYSKSNQVIFFTCHNSYKNMGEYRKANIIEL